MHSRSRKAFHSILSIPGKLLCVSFFAMTLSWIGSANATVYMQNNFESSACGATIADQNADAVFWDTNEVPTSVGCAVATPNGSKYVQWQYPGGNHSGPELYARGNTNFNVALREGTTYYMAGFFRFQRIGGSDIWADTGTTPYQFDKLTEFRGNGFRWGIGSGWNGWYNTGTDHKFTFDAWYSTALIGDRGPDHLVANVAPYGPNNPLLCDYEKWYGVVLGVTVSSSASAGRVQVWVNGVKIIDKAQYTANAGATFERAILFGTVAQPSYNAPVHYRQMDNLMVTDNWQDVVSGGYMATSSEAISPPRMNQF